MYLFLPCSLSLLLLRCQPSLTALVTYSRASFREKTTDSLDCKDWVKLPHIKQL